MNIESFAEKAKMLGVLGLAISQHGQEIAHANWDDESRRNVYSASKSFTSAAVGIAIREGLLSLDEKLVDAFAQDLPADPSPELQACTVRDLLTMCLGQEKAELMGPQRPLYAERHWVRMCMAFPFSDMPGTKFLYNNVGPYLAGVLVQRRAGCDLVHYLMPRLFEPLGIVYPTWENDPQGYTFGAGGLFLTLTELHRFGQLILAGGQWNGKQLIPAEWVKQCMQAQDVPHYSYLFWKGKENCTRVDGKYCQWSMIFPEKDAVITITAECRDGESLMNAVYDELYPQL